MLDAINFKKLTKEFMHPLRDYIDCFEIVLCKNPKLACYLNECNKCPGIDNFSNYLNEIFEETGKMQVIFSTWQSTNLCTLKKECISTEDFIEKVCVRSMKLLTHHFTDNNQKNYIAEIRENLKKSEVLLQSDFPKNNVYVVQNAAQAFHYNNDQCTIHPAIIYYKFRKKLNTVLLYCQNVQLMMWLQFILCNK